MDLSVKKHAAAAAEEAARAAKEAAAAADALNDFTASEKKKIFPASKVSDAAAAVPQTLKTSPASEVSAAAVRLEQEEETGQEVYLNETVYANKGNNHTIEHVYSLDDETLRTIHWRECVLSKPDCNDPELIESCVKAEQRDCLSTVFLCSSVKDWGTTTTEAQLQAFKEGQSAQVMDDYFIWQQKGEEDQLRSMLWTRDLKKDDLQVVLSIAPYYNEAVRRLRGVETILMAIPDQEKTRIMENDLCFALILDKIRTFCDDPRTDLVKKVALYHWAIRALPSHSRRMPMV